MFKKQYENKSVSIITPEGKHKCSKCDRKYSDKTAFSRHRKDCERFAINSTKKECETCKKVFRYQSKLDRHVENVHRIKELLMCEGCQHKGKHGMYVVLRFR